jgi:hypothetical protein
MAHLDGWVHYFRTELRLLQGDPLARKCRLKLAVPDRSSIGVAEGWRAWAQRSRDRAAYSLWLRQHLPVRISGACR